MKLEAKIAIVTGTSPNIGAGIAGGLADEGAKVEGILGGLSVLEMPLDRWTRQLAVNLTGTFLCTKHVARLMVAERP